VDILGRELPFTPVNTSHGMSGRPSDRKKTPRRGKKQPAMPSAPADHFCALWSSMGSSAEGPPVHLDVH